MTITAAQRMTITRALGPGVMRAADALHLQLSTWGKADARLWRNFLQESMDGGGETAMSTPIGMAVQMAILGRIQNATDDTSECRPKPGGGFPIRPS